MGHPDSETTVEESTVVETAVVESTIQWWKQQWWKVKQQWWNQQWWNTYPHFATFGYHIIIIMFQYLTDDLRQPCN